jgi:hypothetical protein
MIDLATMSEFSDLKRAANMLDGNISVSAGLSVRRCALSDGGFLVARESCRSLDK